jgi:signal transduction histidine kinase/ActR/RegA family two-component response regulator
VSTLDEFLQRVHGDDREAVRTALERAFRERTSYFAEYRIVRSDGSRRWLRDRGKVISAASGRYFMTGAAVDVTELKVAEERLMALNETLEQRVAERTAVAERQSAQLRKLAAELTQAEQRERRRLAQILHDDLQQLLVAAKLTLESVRARITEQRLRESIHQVQELLSQSVEASRSLTVALSPPILYDGGLVPALEWLARWMQEKHGLQVEVHADPGAEPESEETQVFLFQAVRELLFNVVKHGSVDRAEVFAEPVGPDELCIMVKDDGNGFDPVVLEETADAPGFGLFSIRERLENMGGRFEVETAPGRGVQIQLYAPLGRREQAELELESAPSEGEADGRVFDAASVDSAPAGEGRIRVLLVDDHRILRMGLASLLRSEADIEVVGEAVDGQMAIEMSRELRPDVVVMDITMPRMNGIDATRRILAEAPSVRVIGMSMHEQDDMANAMRSAGAVAYLTKGCPSDELCQVIRDVCSSHA